MNIHVEVLTLARESVSVTMQYVNQLSDASGTMVTIQDVLAPLQTVRTSFPLRNSGSVNISTPIPIPDNYAELPFRQLQSVARTNGLKANGSKEEIILLIAKYLQEFATTTATTTTTTQNFFPKKLNFVENTYTHYLIN